MNINIELDDPIAFALAVSRGWSPTVDDTSQEMVGDEYPQIENPISVEEFIATIIPPFVQDLIVDQGRSQVISGFRSIFNSVEDQVLNGAFDQLIVSGQSDQIGEIVKQSL